jgi:diguanylate cyclase (GGDEF)-like protein
MGGVLSDDTKATTVRGHLKVEIPKIPAAVLSGVVVALFVALLVDPLRRWLLTNVQVEIVVIVGLGLAIVLLSVLVILLTVRLRHLDERIGDLQEVGRIDALTGAYRKAEIQPEMRKKCEESVRTGEGFAVIFIDIDNFKRINDQHSHDTGDFVLEQFADVIRPRSPSDLMFRYGGDEFLIVTKPEAVDALRKGYLFASRLLREVQGWEFLVDRTTSEREWLTISCGVSDFGFDGDAPDLVISRADDACMRAKRGGRNRVEQLGFVQSQGA